MDPATMMMIASIVGNGVSGLFGKNEKHGSTFNKKTRSLLDQVQDMVRGNLGQQDITQNQNYQTGQDWLQSMFNDPEFFQNFEAPAMRQFNEEIAPGIANRFASMGSGGALGSTGFRNSINRAGSDLATNLAAQRGQMQQQAVPQLLGYAQQPASNWLNAFQSTLVPTNNKYQGPTAGPFAPAAAQFQGAATQAWGNRWGGQMANPGQSPLTY